MANKITVYRGVTYPVTYQHQDTEGSAVSLVGATLYFTVKEEEWDSDAPDASALIKKTITSHTDAAGGISNFTLTDADTYLEPGTYYFDVVIDVGGAAEPPSLLGQFVVKAKVTNRNV